MLGCGLSLTDCDEDVGLSPTCPVRPPIGMVWLSVLNIATATPWSPSFGSRVSFPHKQHLSLFQSLLSCGNGHIFSDTRKEEGTLSG